MITPSKLTPVGRFVAAFGMLPSSYKEAMTYEEQLLWLCNYLEKEILPAINNNADGLAELQNLFVELKNYVDNYFDNLDIQAEVSAKIDEMVESGELQEIITAYLQVKGVLGFDTVADMKAGTNFIDGSIARTLGQLLYKDGKGAFYKIRDLKNTDVIDEVNIIALTEFPDLVAELIKPLSDEKIATLENTRAKIYDTMTAAAAASDIASTPYIQTKGFYEVGDNGAGLYEITDEAVNDISVEITSGVYATLIPQNGEINIKQAGAKCNSTDDDTEVIQKCIDFLKTEYAPVNQWRSIPIKLVGGYKEAKITGTIYIPHNLRVEGLYLEMYEGDYDGNYAIKVNIAPTETEWQVANPREAVGYMKECRLYNKTNYDYKGILNASNNTFSAIQFDNLAECYKTTGNYLDSQNIEKFHVTNKRDTADYAIYTGFLGDLVRIKDVAIDGYTEGHTNNNALYIGAAHNGCIVDGAILHGNVYIANSNVTMTNLHFELGHILAHGSALKITNAFMYHEPPTIELEERATAVLENVRFIYRYVNYSYQNVDDVDVKLATNCELNVKDCYKYIVGDTISSNIRGNIKVLQNNVKLTANAMNQQYFGTWAKINQTYPFPGGLNDGVADSSQSFVKWNEETGTYYYKFVKMIDFDRNLGYGSYNKTFNVTLTNAAGGMRATAMYKGSKWLIYRGTSADTYDKVCTYSHNVGDCLDNGYMVNGSKWESRTAGTADTVNSITNNTLTKYDENDNIICHMSATPTSGTWKVDDIVITNTKVYRCTTSNNTGGVWAEI